MSKYSGFIFDSCKSAFDLSAILRAAMNDQNLSVAVQEAGWCGCPTRYIVEGIDSASVEKAAHEMRKLPDVTDVMLLGDDGTVTPLDPIDTSDTTVIPLDGQCPIPPRP